MSWDATACFKALCSTYSDFQHQQSEQTVIDLQRQIDAIIRVTRHGDTLNHLSPKQLMYTESLSALVSIVNEPNLELALYSKSIVALSQLADDLETKASLQTVFNLESMLVAFILAHSAIGNNQLALQALLLLQKITYGSDCKISSTYMIDILRYLVKAVDPVSECCFPSLAILANLCRSNVNVRNYIKSMDDVKKFSKILLSFLSHSNKGCSVTSLSILTSLYLNEDVGDKIFSGHNLTNIIRLVFNVLIANNDFVTRQYSADLIIHLLKCERILKTIYENEMVASYIYQILNLLHSTDAVTATKIFELLIAFSQQPLLSKRVVDVFIKHSHADGETQLSSDVVLSPGQALLHWVSRSERDDWVIQANLLALVFIKELITEATSSDKLNRISAYIMQLLPMILNDLLVEIPTEEAKEVKQRCRKLTCVMEVLLSLCKTTGLKDIILDQLNFDILLNIISSMYKKFSQELKDMRNPAMECSQEILFLVFRTLEMISTLKYNVDSGSSKYTSLLQNAHLIPLLSHALMSSSKYLVHAALLIFAEGLKEKGFQAKSLGDILTYHNATKMSEAVQNQQPIEVYNHSSQPLNISFSQPLKEKNMNLLKESASMAVLTEKLKKGMDIKDSKLSDIMDFYEHKLAALAGRESHTQDLLESKTNILHQTERMLAQFRCRHAQADAECLQLRSMLQSAERRCEADALKLSEDTKRREHLDAQIKILESIAAEHEELKKQFIEQSQKLETMQNSLIAAEEEHQSLAAINECFQKNGEKLKAKLDCANERLKFLEDQIKDRDSKMNDFRKSIEEYKGLLSLKEQENAEARTQISSLESLCKEQQKTIKEKEGVISDLNKELEKQVKISTMIHSLTSGTS